MGVNGPDPCLPYTARVNHLELQEQHLKKSFHGSSSHWDSLVSDSCYSKSHPHSPCWYCNNQMLHCMSRKMDLTHICVLIMSAACCFYIMLAVCGSCLLKKVAATRQNLRFSVGVLCPLHWWLNMPYILLCLLPCISLFLVNCNRYMLLFCTMIFFISFVLWLFSGLL